AGVATAGVCLPVHRAGGCLQRALNRCLLCGLCFHAGFHFGVAHHQLVKGRGAAVVAVGQPEAVFAPVGNDYEVGVSVLGGGLEEQVVVLVREGVSLTVAKDVILIGFAGF